MSVADDGRFQTFPDTYAFAEEDEFNITRMARHIGNAVPVLLGRTIGKSIKRHIQRNANGVAR